jgi:8-oxo-dGTP diphosphatase
MSKLRITAGAFLSCGSKVLLMKRGLHKTLAPGMWAGIGGHLETCDISNPRAIDTKEACYREIFEEAGIEKLEIRNLTLKYVAIRNVENEIRLHHHFFGELENEINLPQCDEGELFWVEKSEIYKLPMTTTVKEAVIHWLENPESKSIYAVAVNAKGDFATITEIGEAGD